jgi:hypothetical protein
MTNSTMEKLQKKLQKTVVIRMDERSMREGCNESHIMYSMVYWGNNWGALVMNNTVQKHTWQGCLL